MTLGRRWLLKGAAAIAAAPVFAPRILRAQTYPARPVTLMVGFAAGGPNDILGRIVAGWLSQTLGQPFTVENRAGRSGNNATEAVVKAAPDGHTLLLVGPANAIGPAMDPNLPFDFLRDIVPIAGVTREALVLVVHPSVPAKSVPEFIAHAQAHPGKVRMASTGIGSSPHVSGELFKLMTKLDLPVTHYAGGGPALKAMIAGEAEMMFEPMSASIEPVRKGELRALGVSTAARSEALPDVPPVADSVPGYEASAATGLGAPKGTPRATVDALNAAINAGFADPAMRARLADTGGAMLSGSPEDFGRLMAAETGKWAQVVKASGAKGN